MSKKVAIMGYGTIGSGVAEVLEKNRESIARRVGEEVECKYILDIRDFPGDPNESKIVKDVDIIANDPEVSIVVETMGGVEPAYTFVKKMLLAGKSVTTSNKALVAEKGAELIHIAEKNELNFQFEASVGGGIPIIRSLNKCLTADVIEEVSGILNGTTNYMLTKMRDIGANYEAVLKEAQSLGYAEKDPTADVEGHDACRKIAILTSLISERQVDYRKIETEGITTITTADIDYAKQMDRRIKLIASSVRRPDDTFDILVAPFMLASDHPLYTVDGVFNAVFVHGNMLGDAMFYGSGAGKLPTASAVVADVVDMAKHPHRNIPVHWDEEELPIPDHREKTYQYYVRTANTGREILSAFNNIDFLESTHGDPENSVFVTPEMSGREFEQRAADLHILQRIRLK